MVGRDDNNKENEAGPAKSQSLEPDRASTKSDSVDTSIVRDELVEHLRLDKKKAPRVCVNMNIQGRD